MMTGIIEIVKRFCRMKGTWDSVDLHNVTGASLRKVFALGLLATLAQPVIASDAGTECSNVGPNMRFCS